MKSRTLIGTALILASLPLFGGGGYVLVETMDIAERDNRRLETTRHQCSQKLDQLASTHGGTAQRSGRDTTVLFRDFDDPRSVLATASMAIMMCPTHDMSEFCIGDRCEGQNDGVIMKFVMRENG